MLSPRRPRRGIWSKQTGSAAVEFALIAPILTTLLLGAFDIGPSLMVKFKSTSATQTVADLVTQSATVQVADISNFYGAGSDVMAPFSGTPLVMRITNIATNGLGRAFVYWSCGQGALPPFTATTTVLSTPTGTPLTSLLQLFPGLSGLYITNGINTSYIMVESQYKYTAPAGLFLPGSQLMTSVAYSLPRVSIYIGPTTGQFGYIPPPPILITGSFATSIGGLTCNTGY